MAVTLVARKPSDPGGGSDQPFPRVADTLRTLRIAAGLTQEKTARAIGLTFAGYRPYEQGMRDLTAQQIERFAEVFGVPVSAVTSRLWPEDAQIVQLRLSHEVDTMRAQLAGVDAEIADLALRAAQQSIAVVIQTSDLARRN